MTLICYFFFPRIIYPYYILWISNVICGWTQHCIFFGDKYDFVINDARPEAWIESTHLQSGGRYQWQLKLIRANSPHALILHTSIIQLLCQTCRIMMLLAGIAKYSRHHIWLCWSITATPRITTNVIYICILD